MSIERVNSADLGNNGGSTISYTAAYTVGSGSDRLLIVGIVGDTLNTGPVLVTSVTYAGFSMTRIASYVVSNGGTSGTRASYLYYLFNPPSGSHNVIITSAAGTPYILAGAADYQGVLSTTDHVVSAISGAVGVSSYTTGISASDPNGWAILFEEGWTPVTPPSAGAGSFLNSVDGAFGTWGLFDSNGPVGPMAYSMTTTRVAATNAITHLMATFSSAPRPAQSEIVAGESNLSAPARAQSGELGPLSLTIKTATMIAN